MLIRTRKTTHYCESSHGVKNVSIRQWRVKENMEKLRLLVLGMPKSPFSNILFKPLLRFHKKQKISICGVVDTTRKMKESGFVSNYFVERIVKRLYRYYRILFRAVVYRRQSRLSGNYVSRSCKKYGIPLFYPPDNNINDVRTVQFCRRLTPDIILSIGNEQMIRSELMALPSMAIVNVHPSYLPKYRGVNAIMWAMLKGEKYAGISFHYVDDKVDSGDIIIQQRVKIKRRDDVESLYGRTLKVGGRLMDKFIDFALNENIPSFRNDARKASIYTFKDSRDIGMIAFWQNVEEICKLHRVLGSMTVKTKEGNRLSITNLKKINCMKQLSGYKNGQIIRISLKGILVKASNGCLLFNEIFYLPAFLLGKLYRIRQGDVLQGRLH